MTKDAANFEHLPTACLRPNPRNARTHTQKQVRQIAQSIERFGFTNPILVDNDLTVLAGHGRLEAAKLQGLEKVPVLRLANMSEADKRAYVLADNKLALNAGWDMELLADELQCLSDLGFELELTGFAAPEIDIILSDAAAADPAGGDGQEDVIPELPQAPLTRPGDVWLLGRHKLICGDARQSATYAALMAGEEADVIFTDPPYNVKISGHVRTRGAHREFAMASGEMDVAEFTTFLKETLGLAAGACRDGAIGFVCMDWRHMREVLDAGASAFSELKNLCVWTKSNGGMGSLYRSQHELVFVFKKGDAHHDNMVELGKNGRNRTNVWAYAGANAFSKTRAQDLTIPHSQACSSH